MLEPSTVRRPQWATTAGGPDHGLPVLVELVLADPWWPAVLDDPTTKGMPLDVRLVTDDPGQLPDALDALRELPVRRISVYDLTTHMTTTELWAALRTETVRRQLHVECVAGTRAHFTELNRHHDQLPAKADAITFSSTPQMHDTGREQVVQALAIQPLTAAQAVALAGNRPVHVGPVTLRPRFNAVATTPWSPARDQPSRDPRADSQAYAAWVVASAAAFSVPGVASVTFENLPGRAAAALGELAGQQRCTPVGLLPVGIHLLAACRDDTTMLVIANLGSEMRTVEVDGHTIEAPPGEIVTRQWLTPRMIEGRTS